MRGNSHWEYIQILMISLGYIYLNFVIKDNLKIFLIDIFWIW